MASPDDDDKFDDSNMDNKIDDRIDDVIDDVTPGRPSAPPASFASSVDENEGSAEDVGRQGVEGQGMVSVFVRLGKRGFLSWGMRAWMLLGII